MDNIVLEATRRNRIGKKVKVLRREGKLPAVIYGKEVKEPVAITLDLRSSSKILRDVGRSTIVTINVEGEEFATLVRDRQYHILQGHYMHVDFLAVSMTETVRTLVDLVIEGEAPAVKNGGLVVTNMDRIEVEALPMDLPDNLVVDISVLAEIGDQISVGDLILPDKVECLTDPEETIVTITAPAMEEIEEEVEGDELEEGAEPEVVGSEDDAGDDGEE